MAWKRPSFLMYYLFVSFIYLFIFGSENLFVINWCPIDVPKQSSQNLQQDQSAEIIHTYKGQTESLTEHNFHYNIKASKLLFKIIIT